MKILTITNEKGGVGKTLLSTQFAYYAALKFGLKTAVLDFDQQGNSSSILKNSGRAALTSFTASELFTSDLSCALSSLTDPFVVCQADSRLSDLDKQGEEQHLGFIKLLKHNLQGFKQQGYELVIIDTNPSPDIRSEAALLVCTHTISPLGLNKEPLDGMDRMFKRLEQLSNMNPNLLTGFLGMLPNAMESSWRFQMQNARDLMSKYGQLLLTVTETNLKGYLDEHGQVQLSKDEQGDTCLQAKQSFCALKMHAAIAEAQQRSLPIWELPSAQEAWSEFKRCGFAILERLQIRKDCPTWQAEDLALFAKLKALYGSNSCRAVIRQFYLTDSPKSLPKLNLKEIGYMRSLRTVLPFAAEGAF